MKNSAPRAKKTGAEKVARLKKQIAEASFEVDAHVIASKMLPDVVAKQKK